MTRIGLAFVALGLLASPAFADVPPAPPSNPTPNPKQAEADRLFEEGRALLGQKRPKEACEKFEQANKLDPLAAGTKLNLGLCYEELGKFRTALIWFRDAQARASESGLPDHEAAAKEHTAALAARVPAITVEFTGTPPADPQVTLDGEFVKALDFGHVEVDPGHHVIIARAKGKKTAKQEFDIAEKTTKSIQIAMVDGDAHVVLDPGKPRRYIAYGLVAVGAALWGGSLFYSLDKKQEYDCWKNHEMGCVVKKDGDPVTEANARVDDVKLYGTLMFSIGTAAVAGALLLYFTAPERQVVEDISASITPTITPDAIGLSYGTSF